jgi:PAS domain S-box-containing protein
MTPPHHSSHHRHGAFTQAVAAVMVVGSTAVGGWRVVLGAAALVGLWVWWLAAGARRLGGDPTAALAPPRDLAPSAPPPSQVCDDLVTRLVELQLDYLTDLDSRRVLPRALADLQAMAGAGFGVICEVRTASSGSRYVELLEAASVCWSDSTTAAQASSAFRAVSRDITPVLDEVVASGEPVVVTAGVPMPGLSDTFVQRGCLAMPLVLGGRVVGVVAVGESTHGSFEGLVRPLMPYLQMCAGLIDAVKHQAQHEQMVEEAKARETLYRDLFDGASDLIHAVRPDGGFAYVNKAWLQTLGYSESELEDLRVWDVVDEAAHTFYRTVFALASPGAPPESREMTFIAKGGQRIAVEGVEGCRFVDGVPTVTRAIFRDVTRRNAEEDALRAAKAAAEEAARAKSLFLANMSHELRTPMNAVIGMTDLLSDTAVSADQRDLIGTIRKAGESLLDIINNILDFSKIESGKLQLERAPFDVREAIEHAIDLVAQAASEKGLELAYVLAPGVTEAVVGDVTRFKQILINLATNAVKFTSSGEVLITVDGHPKGADYELYVCVRDTGIGIPPDRVSQLFQSFTQVDAGTTRQFGGTGLGLAICRRLAELMGGTVWVESRLGVGSVFHFTVLTQAAGRPVPLTHQAGGAPLAGKRLLVVAKGSTTRRVLLDHASSWGMLPSAVTNLDQALADLDLGAEYDLAIIDTHLSFEDAIGVLVELRSRLAASPLPAVFLGAVGRRREVVDGLDRYTWTTKPIKRRSLQRALVDAIEGRAVSERSVDATTVAVAHPYRILLAEDNVINQQVALRMLARLGYQAEVADNGAVAVEAATRTDYDIVLMDVQMPVLDGFAATAQIRTAHARRSQPYVIGMTALALAGDRERCLASGMDDYVAKPIRPELLEAALDRAVAQRAGAPRAFIADRSGADPDAIAPASPIRSVPSAFAAAVEPAGAAGVIELPQAPAVADAQVALWDADAVERLRTLAGPSDPEFARGLVARWLDESASRIDGIGAALDVGALDVAERVAHTLKSSCGIVGALQMAAQCQRIETAASQGDANTARQGLSALRASAAVTSPLVAADVGLDCAKSA